MGAVWALARPDYARPDMRKANAAAGFIRGLLSLSGKPPQGGDTAHTQKPNPSYAVMEKCTPLNQYGCLVGDISDRA